MATGINGVVAGVAVKPAPGALRAKREIRAGGRVGGHGAALVRLGWQIATGTLARYVSSSAIALCADTAAFLGLMRAGVAPAPAAALGFMLGVVVHWLVSSRVMFASAIATVRAERRRQQALFLASALLGLVLTTVIVASAAAFGLDPRVAKLVAVAVSFTSTSALRHMLVFGKSARN